MKRSMLVRSHGAVALLLLLLLTFPMPAQETGNCKSLACLDPLVSKIENEKRFADRIRQEYQQNFRNFFLTARILSQMEIAQQYQRLKQLGGEARSERQMEYTIFADPKLELNTIVGAADYNGTFHVVIEQRIMKNLTDDEIRAVLVHELSHEPVDIILLHLIDGCRCTDEERAVMMNQLESRRDLVTIQRLKELGYDPRSLINALAKLGKIDDQYKKQVNVRIPLIEQALR